MKHAKYTLLALTVITVFASILANTALALPMTGPGEWVQGLLSRVGNFHDQIWGELRDRRHCACSGLFWLFLFVVMAYSLGVRPPSAE